MSEIVILSLVAAISVAGIAASARQLLRDGYHHQPTRPRASVEN